MSAWKITPGGLESRENDYTFTVDAINIDTGAKIRITITQHKGGPSADLIGSLRAFAAVLYKAAAGDEEDMPGTSIEKLN